jgi:hypothetical protein
MFIYGLPPQPRECYGLLFTSIMDQLNHPHIMCLAEKCDVYRVRLSNSEIYHSFLLTGTMSELPPFLHTAPSSRKHIPCQNGSRGHFGTYLFYAAPRLRCSYPESGEEGTEAERRAPQCPPLRSPEGSFGRFALISWNCGSTCPSVCQDSATIAFHEEYRYQIYINDAARSPVCVTWTRHTNRGRSTVIR